MRKSFYLTRCDMYPFLKLHLQATVEVDERFDTQPHPMLVVAVNKI